MWGDACQQAHTQGHEKDIVNKPSQLYKQEALIFQQYQPLDALTHRLCSAPPHTA